MHSEISCNRPKLYYPVLFVVLLSGNLLGCQARISKEIRVQVDNTVTFEQVFSHPEQYKGRFVLWGGEILKIRNAQEGTLLEVLERPLGRNDRPYGREMPRGRFMILHEGFLDPAIYSPGREITVVGEVIGKRSKAMDEIEYIYPVIKDREIVLWEQTRRGPVFQIGIGATVVR